MLALSTAWNAARLQNGQQIAQEIYNLGIKRIELNFSLSSKMLEDLLRFCRSRDMEIISLHNYCPFPSVFSRKQALPDCFSLASLDEDQRRLAVEHTRFTISTAKRVGAKAVVLHCGRVEMKDTTRQLMKLFSSGKGKNEIYKTVLQDAARLRRRLSPSHIAQVLKSLKSLADDAQKQSIILGIENRFYFREIPDFAEFEVIFQKFRNKNITYWHDVGHACIFEKLGILKKGSLLKKYGSRLSGVHLHNIKNFNDHQAPIHGEFDFATLAPYLKRKTIKVIEAHGSASGRDIKESVVFLERLFHG